MTNLLEINNLEMSEDAKEFIEYLLCVSFYEYNLDDVSKDAIDRTEKDIKEFFEKAIELVGCEGRHNIHDFCPTHAMHDFYHSRNGLGDGFYWAGWRDGAKLNGLARSFGSIQFKVGDDGKFYIV